jgi:light-regulated signal transduction histidine kinase (bacteriophytochrome)
MGRPIEFMLGTSLRDLLNPAATHTIGNTIAILGGSSAVERAFGIPLFADRHLFDIAVHRIGDTIIIECQPSAAAENSPATLIGAMIGRLRRTKGFTDLCREAARQIKALSGFDRVMVYKFHPDGSGEVIAEALRAGTDSFLGLRYPASDIPHQARALYERSWLRVIADVSAPPVPLVPALGPCGQPVDLSLSALRAVSPIHIEYLRNMGVGASMSVSILRDGKLWGLVACHHMIPRTIGFAMRTTAELFAQVFSLLLESRERDLDAEYELSARAIHNQLMAAVAAQSATLDNVAGLIEVMTTLIPCEGIGVWIGERATLEGATPNQAQFVEMVRFLNRTAASRVFSTNALSKLHEPARLYTEHAAGILAIPISRTPRDFVVFFRREVVRSVTWAGNPTKTVTLGPNGNRLTPRKSFESWREIVRNRSTPWTPPELRVAESLRVTLIEIILRLTDLAEQDRRTAASQQKVLIAELNHRVRNILGLIQGLVARGKANAPSIELYAGVLEGRVRALARAHDQITSQDWGPGALTALIAAEGAAYFHDQSPRIHCSGPEVLLLPQGFSTLALVVHELMTNSAKYGALLVATGTIELSWIIDGADRLVIDWREVGGPLVGKPTRRGFGTALIERSIPHDLNGETSVHYDPLGMHVQMIIPAQFVTLGSEKPVAALAAPPGIPGRLSGYVLVVEDNIIIALDAEEMLTDLGAIRIDIAGRVSEALALIAAKRPDFAVLDVNLGTEMSFPVATALRALGVPFCFATGYGNALTLPADCAGTRIVKKPYSLETLSLTISQTLQDRVLS